MSDYLLEIQNIHKIFNANEYNEVYALKDLNLAFSPGELVLIVGDNGSGKSTLMNIIDGRFPQTKGIVKINGQSIDHLQVYQRSKYIFRLFQETLRGVIPIATIRENLAFAEKRLKSYSFFNTLSIKPDLADHLDKKVFTMSPGERQALILALLYIQTKNKPHILLADEPTASLDPDLAQKSFNIIKELSKKGWLCIVITHDTTLIEQHAHNRLIKLNQGILQYDKIS